MNQPEKQEYVRKLQETKRLLYGNIAGMGRIILSNILDYTFLLTLFALPSVRQMVLTTNGEYVSMIVLGSGCITLLMVLVTGGISPGKLVFNLRFIGTKTFRRITRSNYLSYVGEKFALGFKYQNLYETFRFLMSDYNQNIAMENMDLVLISRRKLKQIEKFVEESNFKPIYGVEESRLPEDMKSHILVSDSTTIFKDE